MAVWIQVQHSTEHTSSQFLVKVNKQHMGYCDTAQTVYGVPYDITQTAYAVLCDIAQISPRCPLLSEVKQFYGTCVQVMSLQPSEQCSLQPSLCWFPQNSHMVNNILYYWYFVSSWTRHFTLKTESDLHDSFIGSNSAQTSRLHCTATWWEIPNCVLSHNPKLCAVPQPQTLCCLTIPYCVLSHNPKLCAVPTIPY